MPLTEKEFTQLYLAVQPALSDYARKLTRHREKAEDLTQDTLLRIWTKRHLYREDVNFAAWCKTVMRNHHLNAVKKEALMPMKSAPITFGDGTYDGGDRVSAAIDGMPLYDSAVAPNQEDFWLENRIMEVIASLPAQTALLIQKKLQGMTYEQIAKPLGIKANNAKQRYFNDVKVLRQKLLDLGLLDN